MTCLNAVRRISTFKQGTLLQTTRLPYARSPHLISPLRSPWRKRIHVVPHAISATSRPRRPLKVLDEAMPMPQLSRNRKEREGNDKHVICTRHLPDIHPATDTENDGCSSPSLQRSTCSHCVPATRSLPLLPPYGETGICPDLRPAWGQG